MAAKKLDLYTPYHPEPSMTPVLARTSLLLLLIASSCGPNQADDARRPGTQRERDSVLGASQLPGARGVRGALGASDSAAARNARLDSVANQR